jgi:hypothetical protein
LNQFVFKEFKLILSEAVHLLIKNPVLFIPKLLIAFFYGVGTLFAMGLARELYSFTSFTTEQMLSFDFSAFFSLALLLMGFTIFTFFLDLFLSGLYPIWVKLALKKKLSFSKGFELFKPKIIPVFFAGVLLWFLITVVSMIESFLLIYFDLSEVGIVFSFLITFLFAFLFYFLYPKIVFENNGVKENFRSSILDSIKNKKLVFLLSIIPLFVSILKFVLAYFSNELVFLISFWVLVIATGFVYSLHVVVNQIAYEKLFSKNTRSSKK